MRVRIPGGLLRSGQLRVLAGLAAEFGDGELELTSRANVQLRALDERSLGTVADRLTGAGLLPSASHERVRNIVASPLSGRRAPGRWNVAPVVAELDRRLRAEPELAGLSGRFLFALDDGTGDILPLHGDLGLFPVDADTAALVLSGKDSRLRVPRTDAVTALLAAAHAFLAERAAQSSDAWRLAGLEDGPARVRARLEPDFPAADADFPAPAGADRPIGLLDETGGRVSLGVVVPLGRLTAAQASLLDETGEVTITPWRSVVLGHLDPAAAAGHARALAEAGLPADPASAWVGVTACAGRPRCAKSLADVRADAARVVRASGVAGRPVHWAGCARRCGKPAGDVVEVLATGEGYEVNGRTSDSAELSALVAQARGAGR